MVKRICTEYLEFNNKLYQLYRKIPQDQVKEQHILDVRDAWFCDTVLRTKNDDVISLLFLREVKDAEIVEETKWTPTPTPIPEP